MSSEPTANSPVTAGFAAIAEGVYFVGCWTSFLPFWRIWMSFTVATNTISPFCTVSPLGVLPVPLDPLLSNLALDGFLP